MISFVGQVGLIVHDEKVVFLGLKRIHKNILVRDFTNSARHIHLHYLYLQDANLRTDNSSLSIQSSVIAVAFPPL